MITRFKVKILIVLIILCLVFVGFFLFHVREKSADETDMSGKWHDIEVKEIVRYENAENYEIYETSEGKFIKSKLVGLTFQVPKKWSAVIKEEIEISSPNLEKSFNLPNRGCQIISGTIYFVENSEYETRYSFLERKLTEKQDLNKEIQEIIPIDSRTGLKTLLYEDPEAGEIISVEIPLENDSLHFWKILLSRKDKVECLKEFDQLLKSITIE